MTVTAPPPLSAGGPAAEPALDPAALIEAARRRQRRRRRGLVLVLLLLAAATALVYLAVRGSGNSTSTHPPPSPAPAARTLRLHLLGFGAPLPSPIDSGPCPQGRTEIAIVSAEGARVGTASLCVLTISKLDVPGWGVRRIVQTVREIDALPNGKLVSLQRQTFWFAHDQRHTRAVFRGRVVSGSGRYRATRGTVTGGGPGRDGKAGWLVTCAWRGSLRNVQRRLTAQSYSQLMTRSGWRDRRRPTAAVGAALAGAVAVVAAAAVASTPVIPWLDQHPPKASAHPPLAPACRSTDLRPRLFLQGATGSLVGGVDLRNVGQAACALLGWPRVSFAGAAAAATQWRVRKLAASPAPPDVLADPPGSLRALEPGKTATVSLFWSNWCGPGARPAGTSGTPPDAIALGLASGTTVTVRLAGAPRAPRCDAPQYPSTLSVGPFTPAVRRLPESSRLPLRAAIVGPRPVQVKPGLRAFRVHRGELLRYRVALTNTGRTAFRFARSSCPIYIEQLEPSAPQAYLLNCRPVAAIAPRATVLFAMQIRVAATAPTRVASLTWELAPKTYLAPFATAALAVSP